MKNILSILILIALTTAAASQNPPGLATRIKSGSATPSGTCNSGGGNTELFIQTSIGEYWCDAGTWRLTPAGSLQLYSNDTGTGSTVNKLAELTGAPSKAALALHTNTSGLLGIVIKNAGTSGTATVQLRGQTPCVFDGATTAGHYVTRSASVDGDCTDAGTTAASENVGRVLSTNGGAGTYTVELFGPSTSSSGVTSVAGKTGVVTLVESDIASLVADLALKAPLASPALTGTPTAPTQSTSDNSTTLATTAFVHSLAGGGGAAVQPISAKSSGYLITTSDFGVLTAFIFTCTGTCDVTLPASAPATNGQFVSIKNQGTSSIFIMPNGLNLDAAAAPLLIPARRSAIIWTDAANYFSASNASLGQQSSRRFAAIQAGNAALIAVGNSVTTLASGTLVATSATSTEGFFEAMGTSPSANNVADTVENAGFWGIASTASNARWSARFGMDDGSAGVTNIRAFLGLVDNACTAAAIFGGSSADALNCHMLIFRCSSNASDTDWMAVTGKNGSSGVTTASTGVACDTANHTFAIQEHGGNTAYFYIDGVFTVCIGSDTGCTSAGTHYPAFAAARSVAGLTTLNAATKTAHFFWMQAESDR